MTQVITGSIGFDDWEWGVDLFADDPLVFKKLIYEMRFDEARAWYAEFGPFYVGLQFSPSELPKYLEGQVPALNGLARAMRSQARVLLLVLGALLLDSGCGGDRDAGRGADAQPLAHAPRVCAARGLRSAGIPPLTARLVVSGLRAPLDLQSVPGDAERLYVVEQGGRIRIVRNGQIAGDAFLDIAGRLSSGGERGLLGLAFHPQFATNRRFFVNYTNPAGDTHIAEFRASSRRRRRPGERARPARGRPAVREPQRRRARLRQRRAAC